MFFEYDNSQDIAIILSDFVQDILKKKKRTLENSPEKS